jgi:hypothetical protein
MLVTAEKIFVTDNAFFVNRSMGNDNTFIN